MSSVFYVEKLNATFADTLVAFGLARVLHDLLDDQTGGSFHIRVEDKGGYYVLEHNPPLEIATVEVYQHPIVPIPLIRTAKNSKDLPPDYPGIVDYEDKKKIRDIYLAFMAKTHRGKDVPEDQHPESPDPHWDIFRAINPAALPGYNNLLLSWWKTRDAQPEVIGLLLRLFSSVPNNLDAAIAEWKTLDKTHEWGIAAETTSLQIYNPDQGKGQNRAKANTLGMGNVRRFWLLEWLKAIGFYEIALTRSLRGVRDRKTYVLAPLSLDYVETTSVQRRFHALTQGARPAITSDILAALRYTRAMLAHAQEHQDFLLALLGLEQPRKLVAGFYVAFYKDLGNAVATMNISFIGLPGWIRVSDAQDVDRALVALDDLEKLTWSMDESHSDAYALLSSLRDFISGDDLNAFFEFTNAYAGYLIGRRERNQPARQLSTELIGSIIMGIDEEKKLSPILENEGFKNIAYAIRQSTVTAQFRKKQGDRRYDVRYGLGQELARKGRYPEEFVTALSDFLHKYNAENAQVAETRSGPYRRNVKTEDIEAIVALVDHYGAPLIANLLIAYGYARLPYEKDVAAAGETPAAEYDNEDSSESSGEEA